MQKPSLPLFLGLVLLGALIAARGTPAHADNDQGEDRDKRTADSERDDEQEDRDAVLDAVRRGEILPLPRLKALVLERWPGELVALSVDREKGRIVYEFRVLRPDGRLTEVEVNAADGSILEVENE